MAKAKVVICPYCGETQPAAERCRACRGLFEPLSRQATHNAMGPWFIRDPIRPFQPGCGYETLVRLIQNGHVTKYSIIRGPTTKQFWTVARRVPGVSHLLGYCHHCDATVEPESVGCPTCGTPFGAYLDRNDLGLPDIRPLPGEAAFDPEDRVGGARFSREHRSFAPQARGGTVSSFATDEELLAPSEANFGSSVFATPAPVGATPPLHEHDRQTENAFGHATPPVMDPVHSYVEAATRRALERRLAKERTLVRVLMAAVLVCLLLAVVGNLNQVRGWFNSNTPDAADGAARESDRSTPGSGVSERDSPRRDGETAERGPGTTEVDPPEAPEVGEHDWSDDDRMGRARELIVQARLEARPLAERLADLLSAITILEDIRRDERAADRLAELDRRLAELREERERLRLREFFPE